MFIILATGVCHQEAVAQARVQRGDDVIWEESSRNDGPISTDDVTRRWIFVGQ